MDSNPEQRQAAKALLAAVNGNIATANELLRIEAASLESRQRPASDEIVIAVQGITKKYKVGKQKVNALNGASLNVYKGEFLAITGSSGSGKSTLLQLIGGLDKPNEGTVTIHGQELSKLKDKHLSAFRNKTIGFVFQFFYLQPFLNLQTNIEVPAMFARTNRAIRRAKSSELAETVGLGSRLKHLPNELSGGQMQRAAIARALQNSPSIILADEPTGNLDRTNALGIFELFRSIQKDHGTTIVVVTHDNELAHMADRIVSMRDGAIA
jgi:ABC-type lipoprotein export system ATPase subunit